MKTIDLSRVDAGHPVISVIAASGDTTVIWHVITDPDSSTGRFNGGWVVGEPVAQPTLLDADENLSDDPDPALVDTRTDEQKVADLIRGTWLVTATPHTAAAISDKTIQAATIVTDLPGFADIVTANVSAVQRAIDAVATNKGIRTVRLAKPHLHEPDSFATGFHGDPVGRTCWLVTQAVAALVEDWIGCESARRKHDWAKQTLGKNSRPLILPTT